MQYFSLIFNGTDYCRINFWLQMKYSTRGQREKKFFLWSDTSPNYFLFIEVTWKGFVLEKLAKPIFFSLFKKLIVLSSILAIGAFLFHIKGLLWKF